LAIFAAADKVSVQEMIRAFFNKDAVSLKKSEDPSLQGEFIGWDIDLLAGTFGPNLKGRNKILFAFLFVKYHKILPLKVYQLLASLAQGCLLHHYFVWQQNKMLVIYRRRASNFALTCRELLQSF
jgi:hypothetical protein